MRKAKNLTLRDLAEKVIFTDLGRVENGKFDFGDYPGEALNRKLANALDAEAD